MDHIDLTEPRSIEDWRSLKKELEDTMVRLDNDYAGTAFPDDAREDYGYCADTLREVDERISELEARAKRTAEIAARAGNREAGYSFNTPKASSPQGDDIYDLSTVRNQFGEGHKAAMELRERARRSVDATVFPDTPGAFSRDTGEDKAKRVEGLMERLDGEGDEQRVAQLVLATGSPTYKRAFSKMIAGKALTREEQNAAERAFTIGSTGNYPVPYVWDPTVTLTSNGAINPVRAISRVTQITGNTWYGVNSAGITAAYESEAMEASDNTPTLTQPSANVERAQAFVPFSYEVADDWAALSAEMAREFADAKDILESSKFLNGLGHGSTQPEGLLVGATGTVLTATASVMAVADLYSLREALAPRWRSRATFTGNLAALDKIRQFDTGGGASLWVQLRYGDPADLLGYPVYEWSDMSSAITTGGASILTFGDFNQYHIIDRVGMSVRLISDLFGGSNNYPTGQSGLFALWRNTADVNVSAAFKTLKVTS